MKLLEYHPLTVDQALNDFIGEFDELIFEGDLSERRLSKVVDSYCELRKVLREKALKELRELVALHGLL